ncbi:MAG: hypothetical protein WA460_04980, partial [Nitrososphaeraceae archaeon]
CEILSGEYFKNEKYDSVKLGYLVRFENRIKHMHSQAAQSYYYLYSENITCQLHSIPRNNIYVPLNRTVQF